MVVCLTSETCKDQVEFVVWQYNTSNKKDITQYYFFPAVCVQCVTTHTRLKLYLQKSMGITYWIFSVNNKIGKIFNSQSTFSV